MLTPITSGGGKRSSTVTNRSGKRRSLRSVSITAAPHVERTRPDASMTRAKGSIISFGQRSTDAALRRATFLSSTHSSKRFQRRAIRSFMIAVMAVRFAASMRRVVWRHRAYVRLETIEKPRAAFKIQTAWRAFKQRKRIQYNAALRHLVPFLRVKLQRSLAAKERSAFLLQRVFRSQRERHFMHWLHERMRFNSVLHTLRLRLKRYAARRLGLFLAAQRDERVVLHERCAIASLTIIRREREELLRVLHWANSATGKRFTPLITRAMLAADITRTTGFIPSSATAASVDPFNSPELDTLHILSHSRSPPSTPRICAAVEQEVEKEQEKKKEKEQAAKMEKEEEEEKEEKEQKAKNKEDGSGNCSSALHSAEDARKLLEELFGKKEPSYPLVRPPKKDVCTISANTPLHEDGAMTATTIPTAPTPSTTADLLIRCDSKTLPMSEHSFVAFIEHQWSVVHDLTPSIYRDDLLDAFIELLLRTESIERRALETDLEEQHKALIQHMAWFAVTVNATHSAPPLFVPLLANIKEEWLVRRAEQLFCQEHEERQKIVTEYHSTPLAFLNRPLLNYAAEERRRRLVQWVRKQKNEANPYGEEVTELYLNPNTRVSWKQPRNDETNRSSLRNRCFRHAETSPFSKFGSLTFTSASRLTDRSPLEENDEKGRVGMQDPCRLSISLPSMHDPRRTPLPSPQPPVQILHPNREAGIARPAELHLRNREDPSSGNDGSVTLPALVSPQPQPPTRTYDWARNECSMSDNTVSFSRLKQLSNSFTMDLTENAGKQALPEWNALPHESPVPLPRTLGMESMVSTPNRFSKGLPIPLLRLGNQEGTPVPIAPTPERIVYEGNLLSGEDGADYVRDPRCSARHPALDERADVKKQRKKFRKSPIPSMLGSERRSTMEPIPASSSEVAKPSFAPVRSPQPSRKKVAVTAWKRAT